MKRLIFLSVVTLTLSGCLMGVETKRNFNFITIPPSVGKRLVARCSSARAIDDMADGMTKGLLEYEAHKDKEKLRDLEMENAALRAANEELLKGYPPQP